ncbi:hypothetical protein SRHO_G00293800 [Serrasalmus rhombeus]
MVEKVVATLLIPWVQKPLVLLETKLHLDPKLIHSMLQPSYLHTYYKDAAAGRLPSTHRLPACYPCVSDRRQDSLSPSDWDFESPADRQTLHCMNISGLWGVDERIGVFLAMHLDLCGNQMSPGS